MNPEERWRQIEEAFAKVQPKDEAEREKFERMKEHMRTGSEETRRELERHRQEMTQLRAEQQRSRESTKTQIAEREARHLAFLDSLEAQADVVEGIAEVTRRKA